MSVCAGLNRGQTSWWANTRGITWRNICRTISEKLTPTTRKSYRFLAIRVATERLGNRAVCNSLFSLCLHVCSLQKWYFYLMCIILEPSEKDVPLWTAPILFESLAFCLSVPCLPLILEQKDLESPTLTWRCPHHVQLTDHYCVLVSKKPKVKVTWPRNGQARNMS